MVVCITLFCKELLQTKSQMGSGSSEGLQGSGVSDHFLAQECVMQSVLTGLDTGVRRFLCFENSGSACNCLHPHPGADFFPSHPKFQCTR